MKQIHFVALNLDNNLFNQENCGNSFYVLWKVSLMYGKIERKQRNLTKIVLEGNVGKIDIYDITSPFNS